MSRLVVLGALALAVVSSGCAVSPYSGEKLDNNQVPFDGFAHASGAQIIIEAYNWNAATYDYVATAVADVKATFAPGVFCSNSPAMYHYTRTVPLNSNYWRTISGKLTAKVRAGQLVNGNRQAVYFTADPNAGVCMSTYSNPPTCDFYNVAYSKCGFSLTEATLYR